MNFTNHGRGLGDPLTVGPAGVRHLDEDASRIEFSTTLARHRYLDGQVTQARSISRPLPVRCREIEPVDFDRIIDLLIAGYGIRNRNFWQHRFDRLSQHSPPSGFPKYGYMLDCNNRAVGVIFTIFSSVVIRGTPKIRCYVASWYVQPRFRSYAQFLASRALSDKRVTYLNITPTQEVRPVLEAQGYVKFCSGRFVAVPSLSRTCCDARIELGAPTACASAGLPSWEIELLAQHTKFGCISLLYSSDAGTHPFVFQPRLKAGVVRFARLIYCRDLEDFVRAAGSLGRFLARRGFPLVLLDANGPIRGLRGKYSNGHPKYFRGPDEPHLGDMAYSTRVIFNF